MTNVSVPGSGGERVGRGCRQGRRGCERAESGAYRNGYRARSCDTRVDTIELAIPWAVRGWSVLDGLPAHLVKRGLHGVKLVISDADEGIRKAVLAEQDDEWSVAERRYFCAESMKLLTQPSVLPAQEELLAAVSQTEGAVGKLHTPPHPPTTPLDGTLPGHGPDRSLATPRRVEGRAVPCYHAKLFRGRSGGIGRRARFRAVLASASVGSSPTSGTTLIAVSR